MSNRDTANATITIPDELQFNIDQGLPVHPLRAGEKRAIFKEYQRKASLDPQVIADWFDQYPDCNWGVVIPTSVVAIDFDGEDARITYESLSNQFPELRSTLVIKTGGKHGGLRVFIKVPADALKTCKVHDEQFPGLDKIQCEGENAVVPPSCATNPPSTHASRVINTYEFVNRAPIAEASDELLKFLQSLGTGSRRTRRGARKIEMPIKKGKRHESLLSLAGTMRAHGMNSNAILAALLEVNKECDPPKTEAEIKKLVDSVCNLYQPPPTEILADASDRANAHLFARQHGDIIRFCDALGYGVFDGVKYTMANNADSWRALARLTIDSIADAAKSVEDDHQHTQILKRAINLSSLRSINAMVELARSEPGVSIPHEAFDANPNVLAVQNGVIELGVDRVHFRNATPRDLITKVAGATYDPAAVCPLWEKTLDQIFVAKHIIEYVQRWVGYMSSGFDYEQAILMCEGPTGSGKTTIESVIINLLGDYAGSMSSEALIDSRNSKGHNEVAMLRGMRYVATAEPSGRVFDDSFVKLLTGGHEKIAGKLLYHNYMQMKFSAKIMLSTNHRLIVRDESDAMWRRIHLLKFYQQFNKRPDKRLREKLRAELPGILNWALAGYLEWRRQGLNPPEEITNAVMEYREDNDVDTFGLFLNERCIVSTRDEQLKLTDEFLPNVTQIALWQAYERWTFYRKVVRPLRKLEFNGRVRANFRSKAGHAGYPIWLGIKLRETPPPTEEEM